MTPLRVTAGPGRRVYVLGVRCHHGAAGVAAVCWGLAHGGALGGLAFAAGAFAMWDDRPDLRSTLWLLDR